MSAGPGRKSGLNGKLSYAHNVLQASIQRTSRLSTSKRKPINSESFYSKKAKADSPCPSKRNLNWKSSPSVTGWLSCTQGLNSRGKKTPGYRVSPGNVSDEHCSTTPVKRPKILEFTDDKEEPLPNGINLHRVRDYETLRELRERITPDDSSEEKFFEIRTPCHSKLGTRGGRLSRLEFEGPKEVRNSNSLSSLEKFRYDNSDTSDVVNDNPVLQTTRKPFGLTTGFPNLGNKCYFNCVLQCVLRIPGNVKEIVEGISKNFENPEILSSSTEILMSKLSSIFRGDQNVKSDLASILDICSKGSTKFNGSNEEDAHEFLIHFLECFEKEIISWGNDLMLLSFKNLFGFDLRKSITCNKCNNVSVSLTEHSTYLSLYLMSEELDLSMQYLIDKYFQVENLEGGGVCGKCKSEALSHNHRIENSPSFLIIQLMRFSYKDSNCIKLDTPVRVNKYLNISEYTVPPSITPESTSILEGENPKLRSPLNSIENKVKQEAELSTKIKIAIPLKKNPSNLAFSLPRSPLKCKNNINCKPITLKGGVSLPKLDDSELPVDIDQEPTEEIDSSLPALKDKNPIEELSFEEQLKLAADLSLKDQDNDEDYRKALQLSLEENQILFTEDLLTEIIDEEPGEYQLLGVIKHIGPSTTTGHYTAAIYNLESSSWHEYNDDMHSVLDEQRFFNSSSLKSQGYLFFYGRR